MNMKQAAIPFDFLGFERRIKTLPLQGIYQEIQKHQALSKRAPRNADIHLALGMLLSQAEMYQDALASLKKALKFASDPQPVYAKITEILITRLYRFSDAIPYYRKWATASRNSVPVLTRMARCELAANRLDEALVSIGKAERKQPDDPVIHEVYATIHAKRGDVAATRAALEKCLELGASADVSSRLLNLPGEKPDDGLIQRFEDMAEKLDASERKLHLLTNIGLAREGRKEYREAFTAFKDANDIGRQKLDRERELAPFANVKAAFSPAVLKRNEGAGNPTDQPIFIVGMPRSGTTLIESILAGHHKITDNGELGHVYDQLKKLGVYRVEKPGVVNQQPGLQYYLENAVKESFPQLAEGYLNNSGFKRELNKMQVDKLPHNFFSVGLIHLMFPNAKIIHCRRHPVDCAWSCFKSSFSEFHAYATDLEFLGTYYQEYWKLMDYWRDVLPGKMHEVFYEDTVVNTEAVARGMIDHLGLEWDENCLDHTQSKKDVSTASQWQVRQPIYTSSVAKWKNYESELQPMIKAMGPCVDAYEAELAALGSQS
ncbi:MAG: sulfotransferase [Pseudomonadota bacterium]